VNAEKTNMKTSHSVPNQNIVIEEPTFFPADVTNEEQVQNVLNKVKQKYGRLDVLLNCVGIGVARRTYNMTKVRLKKSQITVFLL
jgi:NAD(P)-dependent dehydrogenase (short-subunit alcohol dehydrogenase family)